MVEATKRAGQLETGGNESLLRQFRFSTFFFHFKTQSPMGQVCFLDSPANRQTLGHITAYVPG